MHRDQGVIHSSALAPGSKPGGGGHSSSFQRGEMECFLPHFIHRGLNSVSPKHWVQITAHESSTSILLHVQN